VTLLLFIFPLRCCKSVFYWCRQYSVERSAITLSFKGRRIARRPLPLVCCTIECGIDDLVVSNCGVRIRVSELVLSGVVSLVTRGSLLHILTCEHPAALHPAATALAVPQHTYRTFYDFTARRCRLLIDVFVQTRSTRVTTPDTHLSTVLATRGRF